MRKKRDSFTEVEKEALEKLNDPDTRGAAKTVLDFIKRQREKEDVNNN